MREILAAMAALALMVALASAQRAQITIEGRADIIDGDGLMIGGRELRLWGIDAPECAARCANGVKPGTRATLALSNFIAGRVVRCIVTGSGRHGREEATCAAGGQDINAWMVENGWARDWRSFSDGAYRDAEARARAAGLGVWGLTDCPRLWPQGRRYG